MTQGEEKKKTTKMSGEQNRNDKTYRITEGKEKRKLKMNSTDVEPTETKLAENGDLWELPTLFNLAIQR